MIVDAIAITERIAAKRIYLFIFLVVFLFYKLNCMLSGLLLRRRSRSALCLRFRLLLLLRPEGFVFLLEPTSL